MIVFIGGNFTSCTNSVFLINTRLVRAAMTDTEDQVKIEAQLTDTFKIRQDLKKGDGLAPLLFN
jgi:hypothetical protein